MSGAPWRTWWLGLALLLGACQTPIRAQHEFDPAANFLAYGKYAWVTDQPLIGSTSGTPVNPMADRVVREAVERTLAAKGYQRVDDPAGADLIFCFSLGARERVMVDSYPMRAGYRYGTGPWVSDVRTYTEGILAIDAFDRATRNAVWHGWASKRILPSTDPAERDRNIQQGVDAILASFPARGAAAS